MKTMDELRELYGLLDHPSAGDLFDDSLVSAADENVYGYLSKELGDNAITTDIEIVYKKRIQDYCTAISTKRNNQIKRIQKMRDWIKSGTFDYNRFVPDKFRKDDMEDEMSINDYIPYLEKHLDRYEELFGPWPDPDSIKKVLPEWIPRSERIQRQIELENIISANTLLT